MQSPDSRVDGEGKSAGVPLVQTGWGGGANGHIFDRMGTHEEACEGTMGWGLSGGGRRCKSRLELCSKVCFPLKSS